MSDYFDSKSVVKTSNPDEIRVNCVFCHTRGKDVDTKAHMYCNLKKGLFNCFRCGAKGPLSRLKDTLALGLSVPTVNLGDLKSKIDKLFRRKQSPRFELEMYSWPIDKKVTPIAYKYMIERGFTEEEMKEYQICVGKDFDDEKGDLVRRWSGRIIFPFTENGEVVYLVGRAYDGGQPKYINTSGDKDAVVFGIDKVDGEAILCEGIISAIAAQRTMGIPAVAVLGKTIKDHQLLKLRCRTDKLYVSMDGDVTREEKTKLNHKLLKAGFEIWEINLPNGLDPDDAGPEYKKYFNEAQRVLL